MSILDLLKFKRRVSTPPPPARCPGCEVYERAIASLKEAHERHDLFMQEEFRNMREQVIGMAHHVFVPAPDTPNPAHEQPLTDDEQDLEVTIRAENERAEAELKGLVSKSGKERGFFSDVA